jgi:hypothetical protein
VWFIWVSLVCQTQAFKGITLSSNTHTYCIYLRLRYRRKINTLFFIEKSTFYDKNGRPCFGILIAFTRTLTRQLRGKRLNCLWKCMVMLELRNMVYTPFKNKICSGFVWLVAMMCVLWKYIWVCEWLKCFWRLLFRI